MAARYTISGSVTGEPTETSEGFPSVNTSGDLSFDPYTYTKESTGKMVLTAASNLALPMNGITVGRILYMRASTDISIRVSWAGPVATQTLKGRMFMLYAPSTGSEFTAVDVTGTANIEYIFAGD